MAQGRRPKKNQEANTGDVLKLVGLAHQIEDDPDTYMQFVSETKGYVSG